MIHLVLFVLIRGLFIYFVRKLCAVSQHDIQNERERNDDLDKMKHFEELCHHPGPGPHHIYNQKPKDPDMICIKFLNIIRI